jgi:hypothetical protein
MEEQSMDSSEEITSIWEEVKRLGIQFDSHETDLYIPVNEQTKELVGRWKFKSIAKTFVSQIEPKTLWYDLPFAYVPAWEAKQARRLPKSFEVNPGRVNRGGCY